MRKIKKNIIVELGLVRRKQWCFQGQKRDSIAKQVCLRFILMIKQSLNYIQQFKQNIILILNKITNKYNQSMFSTTTPLQIRNHPSNKSTSKHHWSFSKAPRFSNPRPNCSQSCYQKKTCLSSRATSFGYGRKTKCFDGETQVPEPGKYNTKTDFEKNRKQNRGFSFTANRENLIFSDYAKTLQVTPDPQNYDVDSNQVKVKKCYTLRPKTAYPRNYFLPNNKEAMQKQELPGPGKYQTIDTLGNRYYTKSTNNQGKSFSKNNRFYKEKATPGPQDYKDTTISADGIYFLSNMKGSGRRSFLHGRRNLKVDGNKQTPGPGTYRAPSDFGHYEEEISFPQKSTLQS